MTTTDARIPAEKLTPGVSAAGQLDSAIGAFAAAVVCARSVDPIITELVRLRCAQIHDCRLCGSLRNQEALVALRTEAPPWDTTNILTFDEQGNPVFGGEAYA